MGRQIHPPLARSLFLRLALPHLRPAFPSPFPLQAGIERQRGKAVAAITGVKLREREAIPRHDHAVVARRTVHAPLSRFSYGRPRHAFSRQHPMAIAPAKTPRLFAGLAPPPMPKEGREREYPPVRSDASMLSPPPSRHTPRLRRPVRQVCPAATCRKGRREERATTHSGLDAKMLVSRFPPDAARRLIRCSRLLAAPPPPHAKREGEREDIRHASLFSHGCFARLPLLQLLQRRGER